MRIDFGPAEHDVPRETLSDRVFTFLGFVLLCGGAMLALSAGAQLGNVNWPATSGDAEQLAIASVCRLHVLTGTICLVAGVLFIGKRRIMGGLLVVVAAIAYLAFVDSP